MLPDTSIESFKSVTPDMLSNHWGKILEALRELKLATYEEISDYCKFDDKNRASRRLKEMEGAELVYKPGTKKSTKSGRLAYQYALRSQDTQLPKKEVNYSDQNPSAGDIACSIIAKSKKQVLIQKQLFEES